MGNPLVCKMCLKAESIHGYARAYLAKIPTSPFARLPYLEGDRAPSVAHKSGFFLDGSRGQQLLHKMEIQLRKVRTIRLEEAPCIVDLTASVPSGLHVLRAV